MKNFNVYDPMKRGQGLTLDGQTLAHIEVCLAVSKSDFLPFNPNQVLLNNEGTEDGSLFKLLGRCITPFGTFAFSFCPMHPIPTLRRQASVSHMAMYASPPNFGHQC